MHSGYIVFVDESGDHSMDSIRTEFPVFVLAFVIIHRDVYIDRLTPSVRRLKFNVFGHDQVILHERDLRKRLGPFSSLAAADRGQLMEALTRTIEDCDMTIVAVVIDKALHKERYSNPEHPYHLAMQFGLERVQQVLTKAGQVDRTTTIVCECRGAKEDKELELEFRRVCDGMNFNRQKMNFEIVMTDKKANSEGLQLADLIARPIGLHVLRPDQPNRAWDIISKKMYCSSTGAMLGHGLKKFP